MYFEIYRQHKLIARGNEFLETLSWDSELMTIPSLDLTLPVKYLDYLSGREEVKVFANDKVFWGIVVDLEVNKEDETIDVSLSHIVDEWNYRQISVNNAIKDKKVNVVFKQDENGTPSTDPSVVDQIADIYNDTNFAYPSWKLNFTDGAGDRTIDYVYSKQTKLEALTKTCELTEDLFWRVDFSGEKRIDIGTFGEIKPYVLSKRPRGKTNIPIVEEPTVDYDFENVINLATVYSEKSDSGMSSLTLRDVWRDKSLQKQGFPVIILREGVNNERDYSLYGLQYQPYKLATNNEYEFSVLDEESIALEGGVVIEGSFAFNDLGAFNTNSEEITDQDRIEASKTVYEATIRKLKQSRRSYKIELQTEELPNDVKVGDKIRLLYDNSIFNLDACTNYWKKILTMDDYFYITKIEYEILEGGTEIDTLTLEKFIKVDRETAVR